MSFEKEQSVMYSEAGGHANSLGRLRDLAPLTAIQFKQLADMIFVKEIEKHTPICGVNDTKEHAYILLSGTAAFTCMDLKRRRRKLLKLISPGLIPALPEPDSSVDFHLRYEAFTNCKVGQADLQSFVRIILSTGFSAYRHFVNIHLRHWMEVLLRSSKNTIGLGIRERLGIALLELCSEFGVQDSRGMLLRVSPSHEELADLVGTTRSKVTHTLGEFERRGMILRIGRRIVVRTDRIEPSLREEGFPAGQDTAFR